MKSAWGLVILTTSFSYATSAQVRNNNWLLGYSSWLDFSTDPPSSLIGSVSLEGASSCLSDTAGNLLFYVSGGAYDTIWDVSHTAMLNSQGLDNLLSGQKSLTLPLPGDPDRYALVGLTAWTTSAGLVEVDMTQNGGLGALASPMLEIFMNNATGKLLGVAHSNGTDYWIVLHEHLSDAFHAYRLSPSGLDTVPVISHAGAVHSSTGLSLPRWCGPMVASVDGTRLALAARENSAAPMDCIVQLFHFNPATGLVSYWSTLPGFSGASGLEFSPSGDRLYVSNETFGFSSISGQLYQYDLSNEDTLAVQGSQVLLANMDPILGFSCPSRTLLLAPNGKIYYRHSLTSPYLGVINLPDSIGTTCNYDPQGQFLNNTGTGANLPNFCKRYHDSEFSVPTAVIQPAVSSLNVLPNPFKDSALLRGSGTNVVRIEWRDVLGRLIRTDAVRRNGGDIELVRNVLPAGSYFVRAVHNDDRSATVRVVVE